MPATTGRSVIDVVDPTTGEPVGTARRAHALEAGLSIRTVHIFLVDDAGRLLLQQLGRQRDRHRLLWGSSVAAFPSPGEPDEATASRRLAEELGLSVPLRRVGTIKTVDGQSPKFVTLFEGPAESPRILEPGHVERLDYWELQDLDVSVVDDAPSFTNTFHQVYDWWRGRAGA